MSDGFVLPGPPGRGVASAKIGSGGHLFVTFTDGSIMDAGEVTGTEVKVGNGPPTETADVGDIYLDAVSGDLYRMEN